MAVNPPESKPSAAELVANVTEARELVASDIEALGVKLIPANRPAEAKPVVTRTIERQAGRAQRSLARMMERFVATIRRHPIPIALSVAGIGLLAWRARRAS